VGAFAYVKRVLNGDVFMLGLSNALFVNSLKSVALLTHFFRVTY
jgi:hypothetical protein